MKGTAATDADADTDDAAAVVAADEGQGRSSPPEEKPEKGGGSLPSSGAEATAEAVRQE